MNPCTPSKSVSGNFLLLFLCLFAMSFSVVNSPCLQKSIPHSFCNGLSNRTKRAGFYPCPEKNLSENDNGLLTNWRAGYHWGELISASIENTYAKLGATISICLLLSGNIDLL